MRFGVLLLSFIFGIQACGGSSQAPALPPPVSPAPPPPAPIVFELEFLADKNWIGGFADLPPDTPLGDDLYELAYGYGPLPDPLDDLDGFYIEGHNRSDDLFMFVKKKLSGFEANQVYDVSFEVTFATNVGTGCAGIGGSPGESVVIKSGLTSIEPVANETSQDFIRMNIDHGDHEYGGQDAIVVGDFANSQPCAADNSYELKTVNNDGILYTTMANDDGELWAIYATDSGFEGFTSIFYYSAKLTAVKR